MPTYSVSEMVFSPVVRGQPDSIVKALAKAILAGDDAAACALADMIHEGGARASQKPSPLVLADGTYLELVAASIDYTITQERVEYARDGGHPVYYAAGPMEYRFHVTGRTSSGHHLVIDARPLKAGVNPFAKGA
jgi:hypothetical protein